MQLNNNKMELKAKAIESGLTVSERELHKYLYVYLKDFDKLVLKEFYKQELTEEEKQFKNEYINAGQEYESIILKSDVGRESIRVNKASYSRRSRLQKRIENMLSNALECSYFLTLTFNDKVLENTSKDTRRQYIRKLLKSTCSSYVANIDFGKHNHREHYHAVVTTNIDLNDYKGFDKYGFVCVQPIRQVTDSSKLAKYVVKLTNHAIKETVQRNYTIYSR